MLAPPIDLRAAFAEALDQTSPGLPWIYRGRALLAQARRVGQLGGADDATALRQEAADLFRHHGLPGWQRHAAQLHFTEVGTPAQRPRLHDRLDVTETQIVRLVLSGRKNKEVASELYMSLRTLEKALTRIYRKLQVATKAEMNLVLKADEMAAFSPRDTTAPEPPRDVDAGEARPHPAPFPPAAEPGRPEVPTATPRSLTSSP